MDRKLIAPSLRWRARLVSLMPMQSRFGRNLIKALSHLTPSRRESGVRLEQTNDAPPLRIYRPERKQSDAALLWIHGGGFLVGTAPQDDSLCNRICADLGILVVSVEYRLAPEFPFPAAADDCLTAWDWLQREANALHVDPKRVCVGGVSAGGGLAAGLVQRLHDRNGNSAAAQWLFSPMLDDRTAARRELDAIGHLVWNNRLNAIGWQAYLSQEPGKRDAPPFAVPARRENLSGLPPTWIGVGDIDLFYEEDVLYARRLEGAGVPVTLRLASGAPHGFESWAPASQLGRSHFAAAQTWLGETFGDGSVNL